MADLNPEQFTQLRGIIGGYVVDLILEEGTAGVARLILEGLEIKAKLGEEDEEKVMQFVRRLEQASR